MDECGARILHLLFHADGELSAAVQTLVVHATAQEERPFPWSPMTRERARSLRVEIPERVAPRSLGLGPPTGGAQPRRPPTGWASRSWPAAYRGPMTAMYSWAGPAVANPRPRFGWSADAAFSLPPTSRSERRRAVIELRLAYQTWPRAGDRF